MPKMIALQSFSGPDGKHAKGDTFEVAAERVQFLTEGGYATQSQDAVAVAATPAPVAAAPVATPATPATQPLVQVATNKEPKQ